MTKKIHVRLRCPPLLFSLVIIFVCSIFFSLPFGIFSKVAYATFFPPFPPPPPGNLDLSIDSQGNIPSVSISCTVGHDYTLALVHEEDGVVSYSPGVKQRIYCLTGVITFDGFNLNEQLKLYVDIHYPVYYYIRSPLEYVIKDTTGLGSGIGCNQNSCPLINETGDFNSYNYSSYLPSSSYWPTVAAGPTFVTYNYVTWFNRTNGNGVANVYPPSGNSSVLFLPGIEASRLYVAAQPSAGIPERRLWEPSNDQDVEHLYLDSNGKQPVSAFPVFNNIYTRDVINSAYGTIGIYGSFLSQLEKMKSTDHSIADYAAVPYDWRLSLDDILNGGVKSGEGSNVQISFISTTFDPYIISELRRLVLGSKSGNVTIVAHSNGGLVAKALLKRLSDTHDPLLEKIDKLILVAVPQLGTPEAIAATLHGKEQGIPPAFPVILNENTARGFAQNSPMAYNLLPDNNYITYVDTPVVTFDSTLPDWSAKYGSTIHSTGGLHTFLTDTYGRVEATSVDVSKPDTLNASLLTASEDMHASLDAWPIPESIDVTEIAGWGVPSTMSGIVYTKKKQCAEVVCANLLAPTVEPNPTWTIDGDGTVVTASALWANGSTTMKRYWVDMKGYNNDHKLQTLGGLNNFDHKNILQIYELNNFISDIVLGSPHPLTSYTYLSIEAPASRENRLMYSLHSPLTLNLYDTKGRHTGISTTTGRIEEQIPDTYYTQFGDVKYIFSDDATTSEVVMNGYATGTFTFNINQLQGDTLIASTTFKDIPTSTTTQVTLNIGGSVSTLSPMSIDKNGDGIIDTVLAPKLNGVVTLDTTPPVTTATTTGTRGKNGWYTSDVSVQLGATDTESGVATTWYSINGKTWLAYSTSSPIIVNIEGTTTVSYYSTDIAGNSEATNTRVIKIDKTTPEALITFDPVSQQLTVLGTDAISSTTVFTTATSSLITDTAGHTLQIFFTQLQKKVKSHIINLVVTKLSYDGVATTTSSVMKYKWMTDAINHFRLFTLHAVASGTEMESHYRPKKDVTVIMTKPSDFDDGTTDDDVDLRPIKTKINGMVVPGLKTNKGNIMINY